MNGEKKPLPSNLNEILRNESLTKTKLISFELDGKIFDVLFSILQKTVTNNKSRQEQDFEINIEQQNNKPSTKTADGMIGGTIKPTRNGNGYEVTNLFSANAKVEPIIDSDKYSKKSDHTSGLIIETIRQLILQEAIAKWNSAYNRNKGGNTIYKKLEQDPMLNVEKRSGRYVVTKVIS